MAVAAALGIDAEVHARDASFYDAPRGGAITMGNLFRVEAGVSSLAALVLLVAWHRRASWVPALVVASSALGAVLVYRYFDLGVLGPIPNMYEPTWQVPGKLASAYAEGAAAALSVVGLILTPARRSAPGPPVPGGVGKDGHSRLT